MFLTLVPAYGRDYKSQKEVKADWESGKDFRINTYGPDDGRLINKENDLPPGTTFNIRFKKLANICQIVKK